MLSDPICCISLVPYVQSPQRTPLIHEGYHHRGQNLCKPCKAHMKVIQWILLIRLEKQKCRTPSLRSELIEIWFNSTACFVVADIIMKYRSRLHANTGSKLVWLAFSLGLVFENSCKLYILPKYPPAFTYGPGDIFKCTTWKKANVE